MRGHHIGGMDDAEGTEGANRSRVVLEAFGVAPDALLGGGGEASVYALDDRRVLRIPHGGETVADLQARRALLEELGRGVPSRSRRYTKSERSKTAPTRSSAASAGVR
jgi:hypothetical protein